MSRVTLNKNSSIRRRQSRSLHNNCDSKSKAEPRTVDIVEVIAVNNDKCSVLISIEAITERFKDGIVLFDNGKIFVYLNKHSTYRTALENVPDKHIKNLSEMHDVCALYEVFITYRNEMGKIQIIPNNLYCGSIFQHLHEERIKAFITIVNFDELTRSENITQAFDMCENCETKSFVGPMVRECNCQSKGIDFRKIKDEEKWLKSEEKLSLTNTKKKIFRSLKKVPILFQYLTPLQKLPCLIPREIKKIYPIGPSFHGQYNQPVHASDEHGFDESHSEQVISTDHSLPFNSGTTFVIGQESSIHHYRNNYSALGLNNTHLLARETNNTPQRRPRPSAKYPSYDNYAERLVSYARWTHRRPEPTTLSEAGFFFTNDSDLVRCFQCGIGLKDFSEDDDPMLEHVRHSKNCPFLPELLGEEVLTRYKERLQAIDPEYNRQQQWAQRQNGTVTRSEIRHPEYQTLEARLRSFTNWPEHMIQTPQQLADAGLYYTGCEDQVRCFACDGGLRRWDAEDDPWTEHCRWFPACPFALEQKGEQFIALVQASVENQEFGASGGGEDISPAMELLRIKESAFEAIMSQHKTDLLEMGYKEDIMKESINELLDRGKEKPTVEEIIDLIDIIRERKSNNRQTSMANETPLEENQRLKSIVYCMICRKNTVNALFLPCAHHELCMTCADPFDTCPVCHRVIREKIRTFMA
ncbi:baculoviral IAP repeat-containing protein 3-like [Ruditapes philippinarum]|uniref:baculoviral IAP repeat-containing protein 3-like n=1 Tax=Ruditapes philippinarum TaxID=129788 RepID=UPI00295BDB09|nr:baculoviral IAP repeat-containing protein 3-like [Ruditapes philippinarum]